MVIHKESYTFGRDSSNNLAEDTANKMEEILNEKGLVVNRYDTTETILIEYTQIVEAKMKVAE